MPLSLHQMWMFLCGKCKSLLEGQQEKKDFETFKTNLFISSLSRVFLKLCKNVFDFRACWSLLEFCPWNDKSSENAAVQGQKTFKILLKR